MRDAAVADTQIAEFIERHALPASFRDTIEAHYLPLARWVVERRTESRCFLLGVNGGQGSGKSTLADFLRVVLETAEGWRVAVLSIDDFYLTRAERERLAAGVHPLLMTRGVPGTHDVGMLEETLSRLDGLGRGDALPLPRFDKSIDERADPSRWPVVRGPIDLIVLEGWCVGTRPEPVASLEPALNALEREHDPGGHWRRYVNERLAVDYAGPFSLLDALVFLAVPGFDAVLRWRIEQEQKLAARADSGARIMDDAEIAGFIQHYERLTRANLATLPDVADVVITLDDKHRGVESRYR